MTRNADGFTCLIFQVLSVGVAVHILCGSDVNLIKANHLNACVHKGRMCEKWISIILFGFSDRFKIQTNTQVRNIILS